MCSVMDLEAQGSWPLGTDGEVDNRMSIRENAVGSGRSTPRGSSSENVGGIVVSIPEP